MKNIITAIVIASALAFSACQSNDAKEEAKKPVKLQSENTSISAANIQTISIKVPTAVCNNCENTIKTAVKKVNGVIDANVNADKKVAEVKFDNTKTDASKIKAAIIKAGYDADDMPHDKAGYDKLDECCKMDKEKKS